MALSQMVKRSLHAYPKGQALIRQSLGFTRGNSERHKDDPEEEDSDSE
jgi:hypothetical protein